MGVDHGGCGGQVPQSLKYGMLVQIVPLRFLSYRYKKERSVAFIIRQNPFSAWALPRTPLGELTTLPKPRSRLERGHPSPYPTTFGTDPPSALAMRPPQNSSQIYAYVYRPTVHTVLQDLTNSFLSSRCMFPVCHTVLLDFKEFSLTISSFFILSLSLSFSCLRKKCVRIGSLKYDKFRPKLHVCPKNFFLRIESSIVS